MKKEACSCENYRRVENDIQISTQTFGETIFFFIRADLKKVVSRKMLLQLPGGSACTTGSAHIRVCIGQNFELRSYLIILTIP